MNAEDEFFKEIESRDTLLMEKDEEIKKKDGQLKEKDGQLRKQEGQLKEQEGQLKEKDEMLRTMILRMQESGMTTEAIAQMLGKTKDSIEQLL